MLRKKLKPDGSLFILYLALYAVWRLGIDFLRDGNPFFFGLHQAQVISIIVLLITVPWMINPHQMGQEKYPNSAELLIK